MKMSMRPIIAAPKLPFLTVMFANSENMPAIFPPPMLVAQYHMILWLQLFKMPLAAEFS